jgi:transposase
MGNRRANFKISDKDLTTITTIARSRTEPSSCVQRAKILLLYNSGERITNIMHQLGTTRPLIYRVIDKALAFGALQALSDLKRAGRSRSIDDNAKQWVVSIACQKPTELGYAAETWTYTNLVRHIQNNAVASGHHCVQKISRSKIHSILTEGEIKPHKIRYYLERRDPNFEDKMIDVLHVYKDVEILNCQSDIKRETTTLSYDEKPGIQAIKNIAAQLMPVPGEHPTVSRDYEYKRLGTVSLLGGIDLHTGEAHALIRDRHRSCEFVEFLEMLDKKYPADLIIRMVLDNHSSHVSKETQKFLETKPNRFQFVFTPKHGSWLNLIESFFSKLTRTVLRHIRVDTKEELVERIYQGIDEINQTPVVFKWRYKMDEIAVS